MFPSHEAKHCTKVKVFSTRNIFGGPTFFEGLVDVESEHIFDENLTQLQLAAEGSKD